jgi:hypothetical protein
VVFSNLSLTFSDIALPVALVALANPPPVVVIVVEVVLSLRVSVALGVGEEEEVVVVVVVVVATALSEDDKLSMNNRDTRITAATVFIYTLFVLFIV